MSSFDDTRTNIQIAELRKREEEKLMQALAPQYGFEYINLHGYTMNPEALMKIPEAKARAAQVVAFDVVRNVVSVAVHAPHEPAVQGVLEGLVAQGYQPVVFLCSKDSLDHAYERYADQRNTTAAKKGILDIDPVAITAAAKNLDTIGEVAEAITTIGTVNGPRRVSETLEMMFAGALALKASDIHIEPEVTGIRLRYRLDGVLIDVLDLESHIYGRLISRLKLLAGMMLNSRLEAQDGRFQFNFGEREIEVRASIIPGASGESIVMRLLDPGVASFSMDKLHLNPLLAEVMHEQLKRPNGLIITTGPTGSGKTTALYAFLRAVHDEEKKIITIENPVEYKLEGIVQTQTSPDYTFSQGLRAILRQDPDIIMVGEIRDNEVAETAIHAAQTGHLVFSTLHTNSAVGGFPRLIDLGVDPHIISSSVNVLLGQRLVRVLCTECKEAYEATEEEAGILTRLAEKYPGGLPTPSPMIIYREKGCAVCDKTGFRGRIGVFEAIVIDDAVEEAVIRDPREHIILEAARKQNIPTMAQDGAVKILEGMTSFAELQRVVDLSEAKGSGATLASEAPTGYETNEGDDFAKHIV